MSAGESEPVGTVEAKDLTLFQQNILFVLAETEGLQDYGLGIKEELEAHYGETVGHGRLYPNLDDLIELGLVAKSERDRRTNDYRLTDAGKELLVDDAMRRAGIVTEFKDDVRGGDRP